LSVTHVALTSILFYNIKHPDAMCDNLHIKSHVV